MAKITRYTGNLQAFGINSGVNERTVFGDTTVSDTLDANINADFLEGWEHVPSDTLPPKEWFNAVGYTSTQLSAYLHQMGVAEYDSAQEYHEDSVCTYDGNFYISLTNTNVGNTPDSSPSNWEDYVTSGALATALTDYYTQTAADALLAAKLAITDIDDTPVNGETSAPISSNWAYDHENAADPHAGYMLESNIGTGANNYIQLDGSGALPAIDGSALTGIGTGDLSLDSTPDTDLTASGISSTVTVDTNAVGIGASLYMASDGNYDESDASAATTMPCMAIALETGTGSKSILHYGYIRDDSWSWTPGQLLYASTTSGLITATAPSGSGDQVQVIGHAVTADVIFFQPSFVLVEVP